MLRTFVHPTFWVFFVSVFFLSGCTELELASHMAKKTGGASQGNFKVGEPYKVDGQWYNPTETYNYTQTGIASWYGDEFHGKKTANGETYNMNELTAAHKTLQMPSLVRVTNLDNGKSVIVRVNDRGPFARGRVMDVSRKAAELLGFANKGTAKVKLQVLTEESRKVAELAKRGESTRGYEVAMNTPQTSTQQEAFGTMSDAQTGGVGAPLEPVQRGDILTSIPGHVNAGRFYPDPVVKQLPVTDSHIYVQVGSFSDSANASALVEKIRAFGMARVEPALVNGRNFYRVRFGPLSSVDAADSALRKLGNAGYGDAMTVVE